MPLFDLIRGFFGLPDREKFVSEFRKPIGPGDNDDDDYDDDVIVIDGYRHENPFGFNVFSGNLQDIHRYFQQQMDDVMKTFDSPWFNNSDNGTFFGITDNDTGDNTYPKINDDGNPRNRFLKEFPENKNDFSKQNEEHTSEVQVPSHRNDRFGFFSGDALEIHKIFEQQIDDLMKRFSSSGWFSPIEGNRLELPDENPGRAEDFVHPRNKFLKPSYEQPQSFKPDSDIDNESYAPKVFGKLLDKEQRPVSSFVTRSMIASHHRKMLPNGGIEEMRKSIKDGKEEVTISRQLGDLKHVVTTIKLPDGTTTKNEEFINFEEGQLGDFNKSWNKM